ncbi:hypothetical protein ACVDG5_002000 [Mesorhizobium sp. ORM6]
MTSDLHHSFGFAATKADQGYMHLFGWRQSPPQSQFLAIVFSLAPQHCVDRVFDQDRIEQMGFADRARLIPLEKGLAVLGGSECRLPTHN